VEGQGKAVERLRKDEEGQGRTVLVEDRDLVSMLRVDAVRVAACFVKRVLVLFLIPLDQIVGENTRQVKAVSY
jgi:hypothetical protein